MPRLPLNGLKNRIMVAFGIGLIPVFAVTVYLAAVVANSVVIGAIVLACLLSLLTVWLALDRALFQDVRRLRQTLKRIRAGDLHAHIVLEPGEDELGQIAAAMDALTAGLEHRETEQNETGQVLRLLSQMSQLLLVSQNIEEAAGITCKFAQQLFPTAAGALYIRQPATDIFNAIAVWGEIPSQDKALAVDHCWALRQSKTYILDSRHPGLKCRHVSDQLVSYLCIPILAQGEIIGLMHLRSPVPMTGIQKTHGIDLVQLAITVAEQTGLALTDLQLRHSLHEQAVRDPLTGLYNRRQMEQMLDREESRAKRQQISFGLLMIDIDHFKRINDTFGHEAGDRVLQAIARLLQGHVRERDMVCRYGGEEFTVILPETDLDTSQARAEALRANAGELKISHDGQPVGPVTISIGAACFPVHGETWQAVLQAADRALYEAKSSGRNKVVVATPAAGQKRMVS